jgi:hypothetical protein
MADDPADTSDNPNPEMRVLGVHPVEGVEGCFLIESVITNASSQPDFGLVTQREGSHYSNWQVAFDERLLDSDGKFVIADLFMSRVTPYGRASLRCRLLDRLASGCLTTKRRSRCVADRKGCCDCCDPA